MGDCAPFAVIVENRCTPAMVLVDVRSIGIADVGVRESGDQLGGHMAAMLDQVRQDGSLWLMRVMVRVNTIVHPTED